MLARCRPPRKPPTRAAAAAARGRPRGLAAWYNNPGPKNAALSGRVAGACHTAARRHSARGHHLGCLRHPASGGAQQRGNAAFAAHAVCRPDGPASAHLASLFTAPRAAPPPAMPPKRPLYRGTRQHTYCSGHCLATVADARAALGYRPCARKSAAHTGVPPRGAALGRRVGRLLRLREGHASTSLHTLPLGGAHTRQPNPEMCARLPRC